LSIFWVHFAVLPLSGPGDAYMSPAFQATLKDNPMHASSLNINYGDAISVTHRNHGFYLHSHNARYPLRYADGRVSTEGQQVTGYSHPDTQNNWRIHPAQPFEDDNEHRVLGGDYVRLEHVDTQTFLVTADVASPTMPTNQEMTTISVNVTDRYEDSLWQIVIDNADTEKVAWKTRIHHTAFKHKLTGVYIYAHNVKLPDWGFGQFEVNGNRRFDASHNLWTVHEVVGKVATEAPKNEVATRNFFLKFFELHSQMLIKNNEITSEHPFATRPWQWPITNRGTSFWTKNDTKQQIYILGNPFGYWVGCIFLIMLTTTIVLDVLFSRRGVQRVEPALQRRLYRSGAFILFAWALHLFPFFLMGRQLFLHHYLPAAVFKYICFGIYFQYVFIRDVDSAVSEPNTIQYPTRHPVVPNTTAYIAGAIIVALQLVAFWYFSPLTYGTVGLTVPQVVARKWVENWDFHFAK
jgi:dolichyl-phosphate-mannose-protein mannosyltransferase